MVDGMCMGVKIRRVSARAGPTALLFASSLSMPYTTPALRVSRRHRPGHCQPTRQAERPERHRDRGAGRRGDADRDRRGDPGGDPHRRRAQGVRGGRGHRRSSGQQGPMRRQGARAARPAVFRRLERCGKPVIAAVNGFALGGGCELAMACHSGSRRRTPSSASPRSSSASVPATAAPPGCPRLVGKGRALELLLTGGMIDAAGGLSHRAGEPRGPSGPAARGGGDAAPDDPRERAAGRPRLPGAGGHGPGDSRWTRPCRSRPTTSACSPPPRTCGKVRAAFLEKRKPVFKGV